MDRLASGRRHARAGSVTVTELLTRQSPPTHCAESTPTEDALDDQVTDTIPVIVQATHRRAPTKGAQLAKLATLGMACAVLCGAVTIASVIAHQRRDPGQALRPSVQITGEQALLPDRLDTSPPQDPAPAPSTPAAVEESPSTTTPTTLEADTGTTASGGATTTSPANDLELVREFYENLPESPATAFELLSPDLLDADLTQFLSSWSTVVAIESVDVTQQADGVLATVRMRLADGGSLRVRQLLTVARTPRRIVGVQLLSAQRN